MKSVLWRLLLILLWPACALFGQDDVVMKAMRDELSRSMTQLRLADLDKPYFISYRVDDNSTTTISASLGQLTSENTFRGRQLTVQVRVGDFALDNTNFMGSGGFGGGNCHCHTTLPLDDDYDQIRREIWLETDGSYKEAAAELAAKRTVLKQRQGGPELPDFTTQPPVTLYEKPIDSRVEIPALEKLARELSAQFKDSPEIISSGVDFNVLNRFERFTNSEGASFTQPEVAVMFTVHAEARADDGRPLRDWVWFNARSLNELRHDDLLARTRELIVRLKALRTAKSLDRYNGPVLFEGEAAAEVLGQVFAPAIVAWRFPVSEQPQYEAQFQQVMNQFGGTLSDRIGGRVMPDTFDLTIDPKIARFGDTNLLGGYDIDDEAVPGREVKIVENGRLLALLASRTPTPQSKASTGSYQGGIVGPSNVFLTAHKTETSDELRKELLRVAQQRGYDYGIVIRHVFPGSLSALMRLGAGMVGLDTAAGTAVYKVFSDGHEEMVRADIAPVSLSAFKDILAAGDKPTAYNTMFISLTGSLLKRDGPGGQTLIVSYVVPPLLFDEVSLKQPTGAAPKPPVLPSPLVAARERDGQAAQGK